jgi:hypothetical protein
MSVFEHSRFLVMGAWQHPYRHSLTEFAYANPLLPDATNVQDAINYIISVLYPNYIGTFATPAALPVSSAANDYAIVTDDGDGKSAGYVWQVIDAGGRWIKRYDVDWSLESIYAELINRTQYQYVMKFGMSDRDPDAVTLTGINEGQHIYGGDTNSGNLTLHANSGSGASTGFVQVTDNFRPQIDNAYLLGTPTERFLQAYAVEGYFGDFIFSGSTAQVTTSLFTILNDVEIDGSLVTQDGAVIAGDINLDPGSITSDSGAISFSSNNLTTTGTIKGSIGLFSTRVEVGPFAGQALILAPGSITDESGAINFGNENLSTVGTLGAGDTTVTALAVDNMLLDVSTLSAATDLFLDAGANTIHMASAMTTGAITTTGSVVVTGDLTVDNLKLDGNVLSSTSGNLTITPTGNLVVSAGPQPAVDNTLDLGVAAKRFNDLFIGGSISDGTNAILVADLLALRSTVFRDAGRTQAAQAGDALFFDGTQWLASVPDSEITHSTISGLTTGDAGHTQFAMLAGRAGGQAIRGGTAASELLTLESTAHATKGTVQTKDSFLPFTNASYSGGWAGIDLGGSANYFRDVYTKGEHKGFRLENLAAPANSSQNIGRMVYDGGIVKVDTGATWSALVNSIDNQTAAGVKTWSGNGLFTAKVGIGTGPITPNVELDVFGAWASRRSDVASASSIAQLATTTSFVKITGALSTTVLGLGSGFDGKRVIVHNGSSGSLTIKHQDAGATAADRVITPTASDLVVLSNRSTELVYDANQSRWVVASSGAGGGSYTTTALQNVGASGSISSTTYDGFQFRRVQGSGNPQTASSTPFGSGGGWSDGTVITLIGQDDTKALTILNNDAAKGALLNGDAVLKNNSILTLIYDATADRWVEMYRVNC